MAKAFFLVLLSIGLIGLASADKPNRPPFQMRVVEEQTDVGLANLLVVTGNRIACYTRANGDVSWGESSLMDRDVRFEIEDPRDSLALPPLPSESHTVDTQNLNFADVISFLGFFYANTAVVRARQCLSPRFHVHIPTSVGIISPCIRLQPP